jgi:hypothetical protein
MILAKSSTTNIVVGVVSAVLGGILGWGLEKLIGAASSLQLWLFVFVSFACLGTCLVVTSYVAKYTNMEELTTKTAAMLDDALQHRAEIIPRESIYPVMADCIRHAKSQVAVVTYYMYDWEQNKRTFLPPEQLVTGQDDFYNAIYECIANQSVEYIRIWQVPADKTHDALKIIETDPLHKKEIALIRKVSLQKPDQARLVIAGEHTTASFILVDKRHLFFNIDFYDKERRVWLSPYMVFIKDATGSAFAGLNSIVVRLTSRMLDT